MPSLLLDLAGLACEVGGCGHFVATEMETGGQGHLRGNKAMAGSSDHLSLGSPWVKLHLKLLSIYRNK